MNAIPPVELPPDFWTAIASSQQPLLALDYDGTLAPFRIARDEARPLPEILGLLEGIASSGGKVMVLSGRPIAELVRLLEGVRIHLVGEHGWESRGVDGRTTIHPLSEGCDESLGWAAASARAAGLGGHLEVKRTAVVLHTRGLPLSRALELERSCQILWRTATLVSQLRLCAMNGGLELRAAGRDKGIALRELLAAAGPGVLPVFVGDDLSDEDAFREVMRRGFGIRVGPAIRPTWAQGRIESSDQIPEFLKHWLEALRGTASQEARHGR